MPNVFDAFDTEVEGNPFDAIPQDEPQSEVAPDTALGSFARSAASKAPSGVGGLAGALAGAELGGEIGLAGGPLAEFTVPAGAVIGGALGAMGGSGLTEGVKKWWMGPEAIAREKAQIEANRRAHEFATGAGEMLPELLPAVATPSRAAGFLGGAAHAAEAGLRISSAEEAARQTGEGVFDPYSLVTKPLEGAAKFAPVGLVPGMSLGAKMFGPVAGEVLGSILKKAPSDAAVMTLSSDLFDHFVHGKPLSLEGYTSETGKSIPSFMLLNAITGVLSHGKGIIPKTENANVPQSTTPEIESELSAQPEGVVENPSVEQSGVETTPEATVSEPIVAQNEAEGNPLTAQALAETTERIAQQREQAEIQAALEQQPPQAEAKIQPETQPLEGEQSNATVPIGSAEKMGPYPERIEGAGGRGEGEGVGPVEQGLVPPVESRENAQLVETQPPPLTDVSPPLPPEGQLPAEGAPPLPAGTEIPAQAQGAPVAEVRPFPERLAQAEAEASTPEGMESRRQRDIGSVERLNQEIAGQRGVKGVRVKLASDTKVAPEFSRFRSLFESLFNHKVVMVEPEKEGSHGWSGVRFGPEDTIFINADSKVNSMAVLGHEFTHSLEQTHPELHKELVEAIDRLQIFTPEQIKKFGEQNLKGTYGSDEWKAEVINNLIGDRFFAGEVFEKLAKEEPGLFLRLAQVLREWIRNVRDKIAGAAGYDMAERLGLDEQNLTRLDDQLAKAMKEAAKREQGGESIKPETEEGVTFFSKPETHDLSASKPETPKPAWQMSVDDLEGSAKEHKIPVHQTTEGINSLLSGEKPAVLLTGVSAKDEPLMREIAKQTGVKFGPLPEGLAGWIVYLDDANYQKVFSAYKRHLVRSSDGKLSLDPLGHAEIGEALGEKPEDVDRYFEQHGERLVRQWTDALNGKSEPTQFSAEERDERVVDTTKAGIEKQYEKWGMEAPKGLPSIQMEPTFAAAKAELDRNPEKPFEIVDAIREGIPATPQEKALLTQAVVRLHNQLDAHPGDPDNLALMDKLDNIYTAYRADKTMWGQGGVVMQQRMNRDYSLAGLRSRLKLATGKDVTPEQAKKLEQFAKEFAGETAKEKQEELDYAKALSQEHLERVEQEVKEAESSDWLEEALDSLDPKARANVDAVLDEVYFQHELAKLAAASNLKFSAEGETVSASEARKARIEARLKGIGKLDQATVDRLKAESNATLAKLKKAFVTAPPKAKAIVEKVEKSSVRSMGDLGQALREGEKDINKVPLSLLKDAMRSLVASGLRGDAEVMPALTKLVNEHGIKATEEEVRERAMDYGHLRLPSKEEIEEELRKVRAEALKVASIRRVEKNEAPLKTGYQRDKPHQKARELDKELKDKMKAAGIQPRSSEDQLATVEDATLTRLRNDIEDLDAQIEAGKRKVRDKSPVAHTAKFLEEQKKLNTQKKALQEKLDSLDPKQPMTPEEREKRQIAAAEAVAKHWNERKESAEWEDRAKPGPPSEKVKEARRIAAEAKENFEQARDAARPDLKKDPNELALRRYNRLLDRKGDDLDRRLREKDYSKVARKKTVLDEATQKRKIALERKQREFNAYAKAEAEKNRTPSQKFYDFLVKMKRSFVLTYPAVIGKLTAASLTRGFSTVSEELAGGALGKLLPKDFTSGKDRDRVEGGMLSASGYAKAFQKWHMRVIDDIKKTFSMGESDLDVLNSKEAHEKPDVWGLPGLLHAALKAPAKRALYEFAMQKQIESYLKDGLDPEALANDEMLQMKMGQAAYKYAQRGIFMQDNALVDMFTAAVRRGEGMKGTAGPGIARAAKILMPIVRVPSNIIAESATLVGGVPIGLIRLAHAWHNGMDKLTPEEKASIFRTMKKGSLGAGLVLLGYYSNNPAFQAGGYYNHDEKRKPGDAKVGGFKIFGVDIPRWLTHAPAFEAIQFGATIRRAQNNTKNGNALPPATMAAVIGLAEETPFLNEMFRLKDMQTDSGRGKFFAELAKAQTIPGLVQQAAVWGDRNRPLEPEDLLTGEGTQARAPKGFTEIMKAGIPGMRKDLPYKLNGAFSPREEKVPEAIRLYASKDFPMPSTPDRGPLEKKAGKLTNARWNAYTDLRGRAMEREMLRNMGYLMSPIDDKARKKKIMEISRQATHEARKTLGLAE